MAQVIKVTTTKPLPPSAEIVAKGGKEFFQIKRAGKTIYCELTECKTKYRIESRKWYAQYRDATGRIKRKPAFTDKGASLKLAQELEERAIRRKMGLPGSAECIFEEPVDGLFDRFEKFLRSKNNTVNHCDQTMKRIKRLFEGAKVRTWGQINPTTVLSWLASEREKDAFGIKTSNYYLIAIKEFCNWAVDDGIVAENPLRSAKAMNADGDVRRKRRAIGADEFQRLIAAARMSGPVQGMDGKERAILYIIRGADGKLSSTTIFQLHDEIFGKNEAGDVCPFEKQFNGAYIATKWNIGLFATAIGSEKLVLFTNKSIWFASGFSVNQNTSQKVTSKLNTSHEIAFNGTIVCETLSSFASSMGRTSESTAMMCPFLGAAAAPCVIAVPILSQGGSVAQAAHAHFCPSPAYGPCLGTTCPAPCPCKCGP